jgi:hypothetical protein
MGRRIRGTELAVFLSPSGRLVSARKTLRWSDFSEQGPAGQAERSGGRVRGLLAGGYMV